METYQAVFKRKEVKYLLTEAQLTALRPALETHMEPDAFAHSSISNLYYDTPDFRILRRSQEKPVYREKLRLRSYGVPEEGDRVFVELKKKFDGIVYKRRITMPVCEVDGFLSGRSGDDFGQIGREIRYFQSFYRTAPKVFIGYDRLAFAGIDDPRLRITFDTNLRWRDTDADLRLGDRGAPIALPGGEVLMEVKMPGACPLWLSRLLSEAGAFPTSFSKYGACYSGSILRAGPTILKEDTCCA